jgi:hypothetical protein
MPASIIACWSCLTVLPSAPAFSPTSAFVDGASAATGGGEGVRGRLVDDARRFERPFACWYCCRAERVAGPNTPSAPPRNGDAGGDERLLECLDVRADRSVAQPEQGRGRGGRVVTGMPNPGDRERVRPRSPRRRPRRCRARWRSGTTSARGGEDAEDAVGTADDGETGIHDRLLELLDGVAARADLQADERRRRPTVRPGADGLLPAGRRSPCSRRRSARSTPRPSARGSRRGVDRAGGERPLSFWNATSAVFGRGAEDAVGSAGGSEPGRGQALLELLHRVAASALREPEERAGHEPERDRRRVVDLARLGEPVLSPGTP